MKRNRLIAVIGLTLLTVAAPPAHANVSLKNGNFFIGYTDIVYPGGFEPKIERVYNSKTPYAGMFGYGWGNEYETYLSVSADGSVVIHEYGGGAENRFIPKGFKAEELTKAVEMISGAARTVGAVASAQQLDAYKKRLREDATFRNDEWEKFRAQGKVKPRDLPVGAQLHSNRFSYQFVTRVQGGYTRAFDNGKVEQFGDDGKLVQVRDKNGNFIKLEYGKDRKLAKIVDNFNRKMFFTWNSQGLVDRIQGENGKEAKYQYSSGRELTQSKDTENNVFTFKYSTDGKHNMVEVGYGDKTTMKVAYWGRDKFDSVRSVKDRDGTTTEYDYKIDPQDKLHSTVSVVVKGTDSKPISTSQYEYYLKRKADGEEWTYRMVSVVDGDRTETTYNECCGLPLLIKRAGEETAFEYDDKGHVTKKTTPNEITKLAYEPKLGKVTRVEKISKIDKRSSWSEFKYDDRGNLKLARNSDGKAATLFYDGNGRISSMLDQNRRQIKFKYNENSKPIEITDPALGTITVSYANSGEIKKVESTAGRKIALQVTSAFQNLLDIIRPAGVSLSF